MKKGKVYLIGAGPMNEKLITLKALECIKEADIIMYDRLVNKSLLKYASRESKIIFVGKSAGNHISQEKINRLLINYAKKGKKIARLKGGDPFIFGRGAEEALALRKAGIKFEIVSGVSSSLACPAYAGIPPTYRYLSSAVTIITGQEDPYKKSSSLDWNKLYSDKHTLIILMGIANLGKITRKLMETGVKKNTPAAIVQEGTTPYQRVLTGTISNIATKAKKAGIKPPAIVIVGKVVTLHKKLAWLSNKGTLKYRTIAIASSKESFYLLKDLLEKEGARTEHAETIKIEPYSNNKSLKQALKKLTCYDWIVFTSKNAVRSFIQHLRVLKKDLRVLRNSKIAVIGPGTKKEIESFFIKPDLIPKDFSSQGLLDAFSHKNLKSKKILLLRADKASLKLPQGLRKRGALVKDIPTYKIIHNRLNKEELANLFMKKPDILIFTSSENAKSFFMTLKKFKMEKSLKDIKIVSIGKPTKDTVKRYGFNSLVPEESTFKGIVKKIKDYYRYG